MLGFDREDFNLQGTNDEALVESKNSFSVLNTGSRFREHQETDEKRQWRAYAARVLPVTHTVQCLYDYTFRAAGVPSALTSGMLCTHFPFLPSRGQSLRIYVPDMIRLLGAPSRHHTLLVMQRRNTKLPCG